MRRSLRKAHGLIWKVLAVFIVATILLAFYIRQSPSQLDPPMKLSDNSFELAWVAL